MTHTNTHYIVTGVPEYMPLVAAMCGRWVLEIQECELDDDATCTECFETWQSIKP